MKKLVIAAAFLLAASANSPTRDSTCFCCRVWGTGMYSPLLIIRVGTGESGSLRSARSQCATCSSSSSP